ncbi:AEC family transporter [Crocosphaera sp. UHCC 0190]|uniref:AEC family transporter n=1 Tax=Crocosphaera sp. UHCC 0190 TaxID=3110246 RepID=UPI002B210792|nr:AEC family transporter [Crocosphaera sp. UHCC 0190]MEA5509032.1 AEC family transporter [Crocosphaera sp. UHCC 0190]
MTVLLPAIIPVAFIIFIGFIAGKTLKLQQQTLSQLTVYILAPALVADSLYTTTMSAESAAKLLLGVFIIAAVLYLLVLGVSYWLNLSSLIRKSLIATTLHPNNGNMGLSLVDFALGSGGLDRAIIYMIGSSILLFGITPAILAGSSLKHSLGVVFKLPLIWAMIAGLSLRVLQIKLPFNLGEGLHLLGVAAIPIALLILGMQLADTKFKVREFEFASLNLRLIIAPLIAFVTGKLINLETLDLQVLILQSSMPTAVNTLVLVTEFGGDPPLVARTIVVTTLLSFLTLPMVLWLSTKL